MRNVVCARTWLALAAAALVLGLFGGMLSSAPTVAASEPLQGGATVAVSPPQVNLDCGDTETVDIRITDVTELFGVDIKVSYDPNVVEVVDANETAVGIQIKPGDLPDVSGGQGLIQVNTVDVGTGTISYAAIRLNPAPAQTGSGVIASITFRGKAAGTSPVTLESVMLSNPTAQPIQANKTNGQISVTCADGPTPVPTTDPGPGGDPTPVPPTPGEDCKHVVRPGDTLYAIARRYGTTVTAIADANKLANPNVIFVGQELTIPDCKTTPTDPPDGDCFDYVVKSGDSLYSIALAQGDSVNNLARRNGIVNPNLIWAGHTILVCPGGGYGPGTGPGPKPQPPCKTTHTVMPGENLFRIALSYGTTVYTLGSVNNLANPNLIYVGQVLCIP